LRLRKIENRCVPVNLLYQTTEDGSWTHLNIVADAFRRKAADDLLPANRCGHLPDKRLYRRRRITLRLRIDIGNHRDPRAPRVQDAKIRFEPLLRGLEQRAVEWRAHRERNHAPGAKRLRAFTSAVYSGRRSGDDHLA